MNYRVIVHAIASLTNVRCEEEIVKRPKGVKNWAFNTQIYFSKRLVYHL